MARGGSAPGERRGGRRPGTPNRVSSASREEARALAHHYGPDAIKQLARLGGLVKDVPGSDNDHVQVAALNAILDRAYGKPRQQVEGEMLHGISAELAELMDDNADAPSHFVGSGMGEDDGEDSLH
jgi:hypothetical protein